MIRAVFAAFLALALPAQAEMQIKEVVSPGGITAWLVEDHNIPFTALEIQFRGGTSLDAPEKRGAVNLMTALLEEGAAELDSRGFAEARDALAAEFTFDAGTDSIGVSARFLTENRDAAVTLLRSALVEPRFDQDAIDRVREQVLSILRSNEKDPDTLAAEAFDALTFGSHPYGSSGDGTLETVTALTRDDILSAHKAALARDRIYVAAAGDITAEELGPLLDQLLGDLPATGTPLPPRAEYLLPAGQTVIDFPTPQASVLFGHNGIARDDPDFFAAFILNEAFGGGRFTARLMSEVREKRGLTYGIGSYLVGMDQAELYMGQFSASNDKVAEAIAVVREEWARIGADALSEEELATTKTYLTGSYPLRFDGNSRIANILVGMQMDDLPIDYPVTRNAKIEAVTMDDIRRVAKRIYQPEALHFVIVGQPTGL
ncbi:MAG: insulinase family protein [Rhodobacterales bacterium]|nr:MAG: insulinase family protein [Rhodobacterales bacterium]